MTAGIAVTPERERAVPERGVFFGLLIAVTLVPYIVIPWQTRRPTESAGLAFAMALVFFLGAAGHVASSFFFYGDASVRRFMREASPPRYFFVPLALTVAAGVAYLSFESVGRAYFLVAFWIWQVHHFTRQNHGILAFASAAWAERVHPRERLAIALTDVAAILATCSFMTPYRETVLAEFGWHLRAVGLGVYLCAFGAWLSAGFWRRLGTALGRELVLFLLVAFYCPLFLFQEPYSAVFTYLTAHGLQYLVFMSWVAKTPAASRLRAGAVLVAFIGVGGLAILWLQDDAFWSRYGGTALGFAYGVTMWHFLLDAGVWRLSNAFPRRYMTERFPFLRPAPPAPQAGAPEADRS